MLMKRMSMLLSSRLIWSISQVLSIWKAAHGWWAALQSFTWGVPGIPCCFNQEPTDGSPPRTPVCQGSALHVLLKYYLSFLLFYKFLWQFYWDIQLSFNLILQSCSVCVCVSSCTWDLPSTKVCVPLAKWGDFYVSHDVYYVPARCGILFLATFM